MNLFENQVAWFTSSISPNDKCIKIWEENSGKITTEPLQASLFFAFSLDENDVKEVIRLGKTISSPNFIHECVKHKKKLYHTNFLLSPSPSASSYFSVRSIKNFPFNEQLSTDDWQTAPIISKKPKPFSSLIPFFSNAQNKPLAFSFISSSKNTTEMKNIEKKDQIKEKTKKNLPSCRICQKSIDSFHVLTCIECKCNFHLDCCSPPLSVFPKESWTCDDCTAFLISKEEEYEEKACQICLSWDDPANCLLCDKCNTPYHLYCLNPPLKRIPKGNWYCGDCKNTRKKRKHA